MAVIILLLAYLIGSIPFGLILPKLLGLGDVRKIGSGNIGATNAARLAGKKIGVIILLLDGLKGAIPVIIAKSFFIDLNIVELTGFVVVIGHVFPIWLKFRGGKGVATTLFVLIVFNYYIALLTFIIWLLVFFITRISSLSSIISTVSACVAAYFLVNDTMFFTLTALAILIVIKHKDNIIRLLKGQEYRV